MERSLIIKNFRNIGFKEPERIILNYSIDKKKLGNLVILVGPNNSGKSNVLDALIDYKAKSIQPRDITDLSYDSEDRKGYIKLCYKDNEEYSCRITTENKIYVDYPGFEEKLKYSDFPNIDNLVALFENQYYTRNHYYVNYNNDNELNNLQKTIISYVTKIKEETIKSNLKVLKEELISHIEDYINMVKQNSEYLSFWRNINYSNYEEEYNAINKYIQINYKENLYTKFKAKYDYDFEPTILPYVEKKITNHDLCITPSKITESNFFTALFNNIDVKIDSIKNAYDRFTKENNRGSLKTLEKQVNLKLKKVAKYFNKLYFLEPDDYKFELSFESERIFFSLFRGDVDISLDYQSTGFKWFFDLYFNLLANNKLKVGDIIIMDEPATNIHVEGQRELRKFLKDFAVKNGITLVIATHSPFLVDIDCLDEIRVIYTENNIAHINNDFSAINQSDPDSLKPIKESLTVNSHVILDPDYQVVFVEGITDYNYLNAFKNRLNIKMPLVFLPINGVGNINDDHFKNKQLEISKKLIKLSRNNPTLLVDGDKPAKEMQKVNKTDSGLNVYCLCDIDPQFKQIESLFSDDDLIKYNLIDAKGKLIKHASTSSLFKTFNEDYEFSKTTLNNFQKVFDYLKENIF